MNKAGELEVWRAARTAVIALSLVLFAVPAAAWNDTAHMVIAVAAYDALPASAQATAGAVLRAHPRFAQDFQARLPGALRTASATQQDRWYFALASTWPDLARHFDHVSNTVEREHLVASYNRGRWHYINLPTYLRQADAVLAIPVPSMTPPNALEDAGNLVQALGAARAVLCKPDSSPASRALALSWLLHLLGDLHQPLHTTALYAVGIFPAGDRGGNDLGVRGATNLHALWDGGLGGDRRFRAVTRQAAQLKDNAREGGPLHFAAWAAESREIAASVAYAPSLRQAIAASPEGQPIRLHLDASYREAMRATVQTQVALAAARTAQVVADALRDPVTKRCSR